MMAKLTTAVLFSIVASCGCSDWLRIERVCDMDVDGICVSAGNVELSGECMSEAIDIAYHRYSLQFGVSFNTRILSESHDLYVMWRPADEVLSWCGPHADGCFSKEIDEIMILESVRSRDDILSLGQRRVELLGHLVHEMMHFWNSAVIRYRRPDLFPYRPLPFFDLIEKIHQAPHMFSIWCHEHEDEVCVEDVVRADILASDCGES